VCCGSPGQLLLSATREEGETAGWRLTNLVLTTLLAAFVVVVLLGELVAPAFVTHLLGAHLTRHARTGAAHSLLARLSVHTVYIVASPMRIRWMALAAGLGRTQLCVRL
jgi:hypothetical protein